ncbi:hypothetical protein DPMN_034114 [Dreissena polymorpha]|uniref:Uncharacterized protein n=1 Tax=Dreissena polymorpha TaxID=45954 RepID=A0A9D4M4V6_DREPO|nr:hypothetical protein DPMN_034114 [Dreissena polymorpha]
MNIISLHNKIHSRCSQEEQETKTTLQTVTDLLSSPLFTEETVRYLHETKKELERRVLIKNAFIVKTTELVQEYMTILNNPLNANIEEKQTRRINSTWPFRPSWWRIRNGTLRYKNSLGAKHGVRRLSK